jgi:hypothetical protein
MGTEGGGVKALPFSWFAKKPAKNRTCRGGNDRAGAQGKEEKAEKSAGCLSGAQSRAGGLLGQSKARAKASK